MKKSLTLASTFVILFFIGCATTQNIAVKPEASKVEIITSEPSRDVCKFIGDVDGSAKSRDIALATRNARNDIRNKTYDMGGNIVKIDTNTAANAMDFTGRTQVVLTGRAFKCSNN